MSGFDQSSIAVSMPTVVGADAALGGPYKIKPSEAFSGALMTVSGLTGETISVETSPDGYWGAPASPTIYRTDWQGTSLLYPSARTNLLIQSQTMQTSWSSYGNTIGIDAAVAPDGTLTADSVIETAITTQHFASQAVVQASSLFTSSVFAKAGERTLALFQMGSVYVPVDLVSGSLGVVTGSGTASIKSVGNGWWRISMTSTMANPSVIIGPITGTTAAPVYSYAGDANQRIYAWGAQIEAGSTATSYIPTTTAAATITDYTISNGVITLAEAPVTGATLSYDNSVLPSPYYIFATGDGVRTQFAYDGVWGTLSANSGKGNGIWQVDLRGAQAYRLVKSAGSETATVNMTLKRDALQYKNTAGTWSVT